MYSKEDLKRAFEFFRYVPFPHNVRPDFESWLKENNIQAQDPAPSEWISVKAAIEKRIEELYAADKEFCDKRWDMSKPDFERSVYREQSNAVTLARQELQQILKLLPSPPVSTTNGGGKEG